MSKLTSYECIVISDDSTPELREELVRELEKLGWDRWPNGTRIRDAVYPLPYYNKYLIRTEDCGVKLVLEGELRFHKSCLLITLDHFKWLVEDHLSGG